MSETPEHVEAIEEAGDPDALDTGDHLDVPEAERLDEDQAQPNADADADLDGVPDGDVVDLTATEDDEDDDEPTAAGAS